MQYVVVRSAGGGFISFCGQPVLSSLPGSSASEPEPQEDKDEDEPVFDPVLPVLPPYGSDGTGSLDGYGPVEPAGIMVRGEGA